MAENGYGASPVAGHIGRIPNYGKTQVKPLGSMEPPACIQNAMMTKDKKPFTYTPGGLDLSQIKTPSMARRLARQRSLEEQEQAAYNAQHPSNGGGHHPPGGTTCPPPPPPPPQAPPPPPPLIIEAPNAKSPKPVPLGERPEIVIPENPIGMLRKTNSPYHWESEQAEIQRIGPVPKFVEKVPSPLTVKMPPSTFSQQPPQNYSPQHNNISRNNAYNNRTPESPVHKPEPMYAQHNSVSPGNTSTPTRDFLQRQDSQFNKSPMPFANNQSPLSSNGSPFSPSPNSSWKQPERRDSPLVNQNTSPSLQQNRPLYSPNVQQYSPNQTQPGNAPAYCTLPRPGQRYQDNVNNGVDQRDSNNNNVIYNNTNNFNNQASSPANATPWRTQTLNRQHRDSDVPTTNGQNQSWKTPQEVNNNQEPYRPPWVTAQNQGQQYNQPREAPKEANSTRDKYSPPWRQNTNRNTPAAATFSNDQSEPQRYQSHMSIPVTPRKSKPEPEYNQAPSQPQKEAVYVTEEPVYFCPDSPKSMPPWVKTQKEKTKTPPPIWCQRPLEGRKSLPRELVTPPRDTQTEPEWVKKSNEMQRNVREVVSPPKSQQPVQPTWSTRPSENRKSLPRDNGPMSPGSRVIPIQMEVSNAEQGRPGTQQPPHLRIVIGMNPHSQEQQPQSYSQPTQRIMRVLSPQLVRMDDQPSQQEYELPALSRTFQSNNVQQQNQPKTRIIPIQLEGGGGEGPNKRVFYHKFVQEGPPRQSKAFKVLQIITGTQDEENTGNPGHSRDVTKIESQHGFTDL